MVRNRAVLEKLQDEWCARTALNPKQNRALFEAMYREAVALGVLPDDDPLEGIEVDIRIARILNGVSESP